MYRTYNTRARSSGRSFSSGRILIAVVVVAFSLISYFGSKTFNPVTQEDQYISITPEQEIALGLQAEPQMIQEFGGLDASQEAQTFLDQVCVRLIQNSDAQETGWPFECHLLADDQTINAFALPGGPLFITAALYNEIETEGQLAGVMAHEIGHVVARHSAQQMAQTQLTQGLTGAFVIAAYDPENPNSQYTAQMAILVGQLITMKYGRDDELQSDRLGVRFMGQAGYDPHALIGVMQILAEVSQGGPPEFFSTHPNPENRIERIQEAIAEEFPSGVPEGYTP